MSHVSLSPRRGGIEVRLKSPELERFWQAETAERSISPELEPPLYSPLSETHLLSALLADGGRSGSQGQELFLGSVPDMSVLRSKGTADGIARMFGYGAEPRSSGAFSDWLSQASARLRFIRGWSETQPTVSRLRRIARIGVELEGAWHSDISNAARRHGATVKHDGSVGCVGDYLSGGEVVSAPMSGLAEVEGFMSDLYPNVVDGTCGLHVHLSFVETGDFALIMEPEFYGSLLRHLRDWGEGTIPNRGHRFFSRLRGEGQYCRRHPIGSSDRGVSEDVSRYAFVNFQSWSIRQTVEFRGLPMFNDSETATDAVRSYIRFAESYLRAQGTGRGSLSVSL